MFVDAKPQASAVMADYNQAGDQTFD